MRNKIIDYARDSRRTPDDEITRWLIANLESADNDGFFMDLVDEVPRLSSHEGMTHVRSLVSDLSDADARARRWRLGAICSAVLAVACAILVLVTSLRTAAPQTWEAQYAAYGQTRLVTLPDDTRIWIHNDSKVVYPDHFGKVREIFADGELYAEVSADHDHPFIINTRSARVKVLGTRFNLSSYEENGKVMLTLLEGSVEMTVPVEEGGDLEFNLIPGDRLEVDRTSGSYTKGHVDVSGFALWKDSRKFYFLDRPLKEIVMELQESFGAKIIVKDDGIMSTRYLASFVNDESLDEILDALNCDGKMRIRKKDNTYYIYPN